MGNGRQQGQATLLEAGDGVDPTTKNDWKIFGHAVISNIKNHKSVLSVQAVQWSLLQKCTFSAAAQQGHIVCELDHKVTWSKMSVLMLYVR